jgi:hypothetical protein
MDAKSGDGYRSEARHTVHEPDGVEPANTTRRVSRSGGLPAWDLHGERCDRFRIELRGPAVARLTLLRA